MLSGYKFSDYDDNINYFGESGEEGLYWKVFSAANRAWQLEGIIDSPAKPSEFTNVSLLRKLNK